MSCIRIYLAPQKIKEEASIKEKGIIHKIRDVLRLKRGDTLLVFDGKGKEYEYTIEAVQKNDIQLRKVKTVREQKHPSPCVALAFPLLREQKLDYILQKTTELGVGRLLPFLSQRSLITQEPSHLKRIRWETIVLEAARQSQRLWVPLIEQVRCFDEVLRENAELKLYAHSQGERLDTISKKIRAGTILLVVGPEGDFSQKEKSLLEEHRFQGATLSPNILRSETAAIFFVGLVNYFLDHRNKTEK